MFWRECDDWHSPNHRDNALAATCRLMMAGAPASVVPRDVLLQALLPSMPFQVMMVMMMVSIMLTINTITPCAGITQSSSQGDVSENQTALAAICWMFAAATDASISSCLLQVWQRTAVKAQKIPENSKTLMFFFVAACPASCGGCCANDAFLFKPE